MDEARSAIRAFCAYRERSQREVQIKLQSYGLIPDVADQLLIELIQESYLNEERFAKAFVRGKFRIKKWGRVKIKRELYIHQLSDYVLKKAFAEIDEEEYLSCLQSLYEKKKTEIKTKNHWQRKKQLSTWLINKGYESDLVWDLLNDQSS